MTDFRALCAELAYELDAETGYTTNDGVRITHPTVVEARAALAQPEPQGPTDAELKATMLQAIKDFPPSHPDAKPLSEFKYELELEYRKARAVLARWGRPAIEPVPVSERLPGPEDCDAEGCCWAIGKRGHWMCVHAIGRSWSNPIYTHWLPHWALPVPGVEGKP